MKPLNILIVEDNEVMRDMFKLMCKEHAKLFGLTHNIIAVPDLDLARTALAQFVPDVHMSDWHLPDGKGSDIFIDIHRLNPKVFILLFSSDSRAKGHGEYRFFNKTEIDSKEINNILTLKARSL